MTCLGDVVAALVDGELDHAARERAQRHLAHCSSCRREVAGQRRLKARLTGGGDEPAPSDALTARLLGLRLEAPSSAGSRDVAVAGALARVVQESGQPAADPAQAGTPVRSRRLRPAGRRRPAPGASGPAWSEPTLSGASPSGPATARAGAAGPQVAPGRRRRRRLRRTAAVGSAVAVLGVALALGGPPATGPSTPVDPGSPAFVGVFVTSTSGQPTGTTSTGGGRSQR